VLVEAAVLTAVLLQVPQDESLECRVERYAAGDEAQIQPLRAAGPSAMRVLGSYRTNSRVTSFMRELRRATASAEDREIEKVLSRRTPKTESDHPGFLKAVVAVMGNEIPWSLELLEFERIGCRPVTWPKETSGLDVLEDLCRQAKVDFAFRGGMVKIAPGDRLWPAPAPRTRLLTEEEIRRAQLLISLLGAESPVKRYEATLELRKYGPPLIPLLEESTAGADLELSSRCKRLAAELRPSAPPTPKKICMITRSKHGLSWNGDPATTFTSYDRPAMTFYRTAMKEGPIQEVTMTADRGEMETKITGGGIKVTLTGNVLALGPDGAEVRADEAVIDMLEESLVLRGKISIAEK